MLESPKVSGAGLREALGVRLATRPDTGCSQVRLPSESREVSGGLHDHAEREQRYATASTPDLAGGPELDLGPLRLIADLAIQELADTGWPEDDEEGGR